MTHFFYIDSEGKQKGPFTLEELRSEPIKKDTLVWTQGMAEWKRANDVVEIKPLFEFKGPSTSPETNIPQQENYQFNPQAKTGVDSVLMPKTWMVESILVTILPFILCGNIFSLLGIVAIVSASKVESLFRQGLFTEATEASLNAGRWTKITFWVAIGAIILGIISIVLFVVFFGSLAGISSMLSI
ncbi:MAG: GYF domain-containing protein [Dysgonamonadaceae bacterium]|nr:GYF domain-containing protein [Dysgonamonadaceae bacterium]MDD4728142.1 GYF domain-containing protein [Dysgonamonadaceae bacterium]